MDPERMQAAADRLAAKLDALALDEDERELLRTFLVAGAGAIELADDEVEGFALNAYLKLMGTKQGKTKGFDEAPKETVSFEYGGLIIRYAQQKP